MELLALAVGALIGWWVLSGRGIDYIMTLFYFAPVRNHQRFMVLYDLADDEATFSFNNSSEEFSVKTHAEYLHVHEATRKTAYVRFRKYYDALLLLLILRLLPIALLPAILFWSRWYWYLLGVLTSVVVLAIHKTYLEGYKIGWYQRMLIGAVMISYLKEKKKKS